MASLLVTGGAGFIGANFVRFWRERHPTDALVVLDALTYAGDRMRLQGVQGADLVVGDIRDTALVIRLLRERNVDTIVHFAAESHVDRSIEGADAFVETNILGTHSLLKAAQQVWLRQGRPVSHRFHHVSTDEVFGSLEPSDPPFTEATPYAPNSPYSASKASADHLVRAYSQTFGLDVTTSYCSNNYGPFQHPEKLIPLFITNALLGRQLPLYGDGMNVRDWMHVEDHCRGIEAILLRGRSGETYSLGGCAPMSNRDVTTRICDAIDALLEDRSLSERFPDAAPARGRRTAELIRFVGDRPGHDRRYATDCAKAQALLGFSASHSFDQSLASTIDWYLDHQTWWSRLVRSEAASRWDVRSISTPACPASASDSD